MVPQHVERSHYIKQYLYIAGLFTFRVDRDSHPTRKLVVMYAVGRGGVAYGGVVTLCA